MKKLIGIYILIMMIPNLLLGKDTVLPDSISLWINQAKFFRQLSIASDAEMKNILTLYYSKIYIGEALHRITTYMENGDIGSSYYTHFFDTRDFVTHYKVSQLDNEKNNVYELYLERKQCHDVNYLFLNESTLIEDKKVQNLTQREFNAWRKQFNTPIDDATFCLAERKIVNFTLTKTSPLLIIEEEHRLLGSEIELIPVVKKEND